MVYGVKEYEVWTWVKSPHFINYSSGGDVAFCCCWENFTLNVVMYMHVI